MIGLGERKYLDICQVRLWEVRMELESYAKLFKNLGGENFNFERMIGSSGLKVTPSLILRAHPRYYD